MPPSNRGHRHGRGKSGAGVGPIWRSSAPSSPRRNYARRSMASYFVSICDPAKVSASNRRPRSLKDICLNYQVTHLGAVVEPALIRILARFGLDFEPLGGPVEHHGIRQPRVARLVELIRRSRAGDNPALAVHGGDVDIFRLDAGRLRQGFAQPAERELTDRVHARRSGDHHPRLDL